MTGSCQAPAKLYRDRPPAIVSGATLDPPLGVALSSMKGDTLIPASIVVFVRQWRRIAASLPSPFTTAIFSVCNNAQMPHSGQT
jgi:hypothetical protein